MPFANVNNARLWYDVLPATRSAADTLLLHHGYTASRVNWLPVAQRLAGRYQVVLMECRGTGESEHTADGYTLEQYAADVIGVADHLRLAQFTYAGHSMGGGVGYVLALNYAARLSRLILMAAVPADGFPAPDVAAREQHIAVRKRRDRQTLLEQYRAGRIRPDVETDAWFNSRVDHIFSVSDGHYEQGAESMQKLSVGDRLGTLITPTLVLAVPAAVAFTPTAVETEPVAWAPGPTCTDCACARWGVAAITSIWQALDPAAAALALVAPWSEET